MKEPPRTLLEACLVGAVALGLGLAANALNPDGLAIRRDYFRTAEPAPAAPPPVARQADGAPAPADATPRGKTESAPAESAAPAFADAEEAATAERLRERGLQPWTHAQAVEAFENPMHAAGATLFVDARKDEEYGAGHVPGAWPLDHYHLERSLDDVLAVARDAPQVVVYCHGKDCNDSELAAQDLVGFGVDESRIAVYVGGWTAWTQAGLPVEKGPRGGAGP